MEKTTNKTFKIVLVGDASAGKTSWVKGLTSLEFETTYIQTKEILTYNFALKTTKGVIDVQIVDIPATKKNDSDPSHYSNTDAAIFFIDTSNTTSWYESSVSWYKDIARVTGIAATETEDSFMGIPQITCYNKSDLYTCLIPPGCENTHFLISVKNRWNIFKPITAALKILGEEADLELILTEKPLDPLSGPVDPSNDVQIGPPS